jgi:phage N-6-adenine-methyltransferase
MSNKTENKSSTPIEIRDLWQTPKFVFDYYDKRFGFNLDMASSHKNHLCNHYLTEDENALNYATMDGALDVIGANTGANGAVFCNPPYSNLMPWVAAVVEYASLFNVPFVMLIPADTSTKWFKLAFDNCSECHFISGRLAFINADTQKPVSGNNKGSVVFIFDSLSPLKSQVALINRDEMS